MEYKQICNVFIVRMDPGEEICAKLLEISEKENISLAKISGLGAINEFTTGVFDPVEKKYYANHFEGMYEITSLTGTLTRKNGAPYLHVHMSAGDRNGCVAGGHLNSARVSATAEIIIQKIYGEVGRSFSEDVGLNLLDF